MTKLFKNFFFKKKEITLDCFTHIPYVYDHAKINYGVKYMPDWWKTMPSKTTNGDPTIKNCIGLSDFYKTGIVIPSWFELNLKIHSIHDQEFAYTWESSNKAVDTDHSHSKEQFIGYAGNNGTNIKLNTPWLFKTNKLIRFTWTQPSWSMRDYIDRLTILPAVVDYKYQHDTNINFLILNKEEYKTITIQPLTPLVIMHPMTDIKVKIKNHLISTEEYNRMYGVEEMFFLNNKNLYLTKKKLVNKIENVEGCPYRSKGDIHE